MSLHDENPYRQKIRGKRVWVDESSFSGLIASSSPALARTAICEPAPFLWPNKSGRRARACRVTSPAIGCASSFVSVLARYVVSANRSKRRTSRPSFVLATIRRITSLGDLVQLGNQQGRHAGHRDIERPRIGRIKPPHESVYGRRQLPPDRSPFARPRHHGRQVERLAALDRPWTQARASRSGPRSWSRYQDAL
jgi:hypothetical protein